MWCKKIVFLFFLPKITVLHFLHLIYSWIHYFFLSFFLLSSFPLYFVVFLSLANHIFLLSFLYVSVTSFYLFLFLSLNQTVFLSLGFLILKQCMQFETGDNIPRRIHSTKRRLKITYGNSHFLFLSEFSSSKNKTFSTRNSISFFSLLNSSTKWRLVVDGEVRLPQRSESPPQHIFDAHTLLVSWCAHVFWFFSIISASVCGYHIYIQTLEHWDQMER